MRSHLFAILLTAIGLVIQANATEEHLLSVYQPLLTSPEIEIELVTYVTWYGGMEESTMAAMAWPAMLDSPHKERNKRDLNIASLLGVKLLLEEGETEGWRVTLDLTEFKALSDDLRKERLAEKIGRPEVIERVLNAASKNLGRVGIFDCALNVLGEEAHEDLKGMTFPGHLNPVAEVWGAWTFKHLPKTLVDGNLHQLVAQCLLAPQALDTIFLIVSGEDWSAESRAEWGDLLRQLMGRLGDETFARHLSKAEDEVRRGVFALLQPATKEKDESLQLDMPGLFKKTFSLMAP